MAGRYNNLCEYKKKDQCNYFPEVQLSNFNILMLCLLKYFYSASKTELWHNAQAVASDRAI